MWMKWHVKVEHNTGVYVPNSFRIVCGFFYVRSQISLQRQHFLLSYLKTLSVGPAGVRTRDLPLSRPTLLQLRQPGDAHQPEVRPPFSYALTITNFYCKVSFLLWRWFTREFLVTKPLPNDAKRPLPVDVRRSKTLLLKLPIILALTTRICYHQHTQTSK